MYKYSRAFFLYVDNKNAVEVYYFPIFSTFGGVHSKPSLASAFSTSYVSEHSEALGDWLSWSAMSSNNIKRIKADIRELAQNPSSSFPALVLAAAYM